jgi:hypothetical protein
MNILKFEIPFFPALLLLGTDMLTRVAAQGRQRSNFQCIDWEQAVEKSFRVLAVRVKIKERGTIR